MEAIDNLSRINPSEVIVSVIIILVAVRFVWELIDWFSTKTGLELRSQRLRKEETNLVNHTAADLKKLEEESRETDEQMETKMQELVSIVDSIGTTVGNMDNKLDKLQGGVTIMQTAQREMLYERLTQKISYYINVIHGIPENEYENFCELFQCYDELKGNHGLHTKYNWCINNLPIVSPSNRNSKDEDE